eukprot:663930-Pyramimonas_sp.AAC.1
MLAARPAHLVLPAAACRACPEGRRSSLLKPRDARSPRWRRRTATIAQRELPLKGSRRREALATLAALAS